MAEMGNWSDRDNVRIATMKLEDTARLFVEAAPEIRGREVSWTELKRPSSNGSESPVLITSFFYN
jgi:hypothetical protein